MTAGLAASCCIISPALSVYCIASRLCVQTTSSKSFTSVFAFGLCLSSPSTPSTSTSFGIRNVTSRVPHALGSGSPRSCVVCFLATSLTSLFNVLATRLQQGDEYVQHFTRQLRVLDRQYTTAADLEVRRERRSRSSMPPQFLEALGNWITGGGVGTQGRKRSMTR